MRKEEQRLLEEQHQYKEFWRCYERILVLFKGPSNALHVLIGSEVSNKQRVRGK